MIETERLLLRRPQAVDIDGWAAFSACPIAMRHLGGPAPRTAAWTAMAAASGSWSLQGFGPFSVILRETGEWIGRVGPFRPDGWPAAEIAWGLRTEFQGRGYAREAALAAIGYAFDTLGWEAVCHVIAPDNLASIRVAESVGSHHIGPVALPPPYDTRVAGLWRQLRSEWTPTSPCTGPRSPA